MSPAKHASASLIEHRSIAVNIQYRSVMEATNFSDTVALLPPSQSRNPNSSTMEEIELNIFQPSHYDDLTVNRDNPMGQWDREACPNRITPIHSLLTRIPILSEMRVEPSMKWNGRECIELCC